MDRVVSLRPGSAVPEGDVRARLCVACPLSDREFLMYPFAVHENIQHKGQHLSCSLYNAHYNLECSEDYVVSPPRYCMFHA